MHDRRRIVALGEGVRCAVHHSGLQQLLILGGKRVVLLELLDLLVYRPCLFPCLAQLGGLHRSYLLVIIVMQERALFRQLVLQLPHRLFLALAVHLIVAERFNFCIAILRIWGYTVIRSHLSMSAAPKGGVGRARIARMTSFIHQSNAVRGIRIAIDRPIRIDALRELHALSLRFRLHHRLLRRFAVLHRLGERNIFRRSIVISGILAYTISDEGIIRQQPRQLEPAVKSLIDALVFIWQIPLCISVDKPHQICYSNIRGR